MLNKYVYRFIFTLFIIIIGVIDCSEIPRPRGVSLARASLYTSGEKFVCLDGSLTIPFTQINDDYCDCPDGSDEPGTSACSNGVFCCHNVGHKSIYIPSSRVNDGICDCCDASDEYASKKCINNCNEIGHTARVEAQKKAELIKLGSQVRAENCQKGLLIKQERKEKLNLLNRNRAELENIKKEKEALKTDAEKLENEALEQYRQIEEEQRKVKAEEEEMANRNEALDVFVRYDSNADGKIEISELKTRKALDRDNNGEISEEEIRDIIGEHTELDFEQFYTDAWIKLKPFIVMESGLFKPPENEATEVEDLQENEEQYQEEEGGEAEEHEEEEEEAEEVEAEQETTEVKPQYDEETQKLIEIASEARTQLNSADKNLRDLQTEIRDIDEFLQKDYGNEDEFLVLENKCFEYTDREYIYKLCPYHEVTQRSKSGGSETKLGNWNRWVGPEHNVYEMMLYDRGASCWNGPQRSTHVRLQCGNDDVITSVTEPNRCEYFLEFTTPSACNPILIDQLNDVHDEL